MLNAGGVTKGERDREDERNNIRVSLLIFMIAD